MEITKLSILTFDLPRSIVRTPACGELISSISRIDGRALSTYLIGSVREVNRRNPDGDRRFKLTVRLVDRGDPAGVDWWLHWNRRKKSLGRTRSIDQLRQTAGRKSPDQRANKSLRMPFEELK